MEEKRVILVASDEAAKGLQPADRPVDDPIRLTSAGLALATSMPSGRPVPSARTTIFEPARAGDVRDSLADIHAAREVRGYAPQVTFEEGLRRSIEYYRTLVK